MADDPPERRVPLTPLREMAAAKGPDPQTLEAHPPERLEAPDPVVEWNYDTTARRRSGPSVFAWLGLALAAVMMVAATALVVAGAISGWPWTIVMVMAALVLAGAISAGTLDP